MELWGWYLYRFSGKKHQGDAEEERDNTNVAVWPIVIYSPDSTPPQPFYGPFSGTTRVSRCQKRTSGLYGAREC